MTDFFVKSRTSFLFKILSLSLSFWRFILHSIHVALRTIVARLKTAEQYWHLIVWYLTEDIKFVVKAIMEY
jgi:hypothetical protein